MLGDHIAIRALMMMDGATFQTPTIIEHDLQMTGPSIESLRVVWMMIRSSTASIIRWPSIWLFCRSDLIFIVFLCAEINCWSTLFY